MLLRFFLLSVWFPSEPEFPAQLPVSAPVSASALPLAKPIHSAPVLLLQVLSAPPKQKRCDNLPEPLFFSADSDKSHSSHKNCQCQTHRSRIRKNRSFLFSPFLRIFTIYDLSEISDSPVLHFLGCLSALFLAAFDHIRLHLRIFLIINIIPAQFCHHAAIITEKGILRSPGSISIRIFSPPKCLRCTFTKSSVISIAI